VKINLLPSEKRKNFRSHRTLFAILAVLIVLAPLFYYSYWFASRVELLVEQRTQMEVRVTKLQPIEILLKEKATLVQQLEGIKGQPLPVEAGKVQYLNEIARLLPDTLFITSLSLDDSMVLLEGVTPSYALAAEFLKVLAGSKLFESPSLDYLRRDAGKHAFALTVKIRRASPE